MVYDIIIGRPEEDRKLFGKKGTILLGKHYVKMGAITSLSNEIYLDVTRSHVVFVVGKRGSGKCLTGDTLITLENGLEIPIKDLENNKEKIFGLDEKFKINSFKKTGFFKREVNEIVRVKLRSGREIKLTPEHPLLTINGWKEVNNLTIGSRIATPRKIKCLGKEKISDSELKLLAYFIAEGSITGGNNPIGITNQNIKIMTEIEKCVSEIFNDIKIRKQINGKNYQYYFSSKKRTKIPSTKIWKKSSLQLWLEKLRLLGKKSNNKIIPSPMFKLKKEKIALFINRLFAGDGCVIISKNRDSHRIGYASNSVYLLKQLQSLLLRFGILSRLELKHQNSIFIEGKENILKFFKEMGFIFTKEKKCRQLIKFYKNKKAYYDTVPHSVWDLINLELKNNGLSYYKLAKKLNKNTSLFSNCKRRNKNLQITTLKSIANILNSEELLKLSYSDIFWDEILSIEKLEGNFTVYDTTVPEVHNFIANNIIVHNSYSMGVVAEGMSNLPEEISNNLAVIILDTMGIYWTMKYPNKKDKDLLDEWELKAMPLNIQIYTPTGYYKKYKEQGIPTDFPFSIKPNELSAYEWCLTFGVSLNDAIGVLIERIVSALKEKKDNFSIDDIIKEIKGDKTEEEHVKNAAINRFISAKTWGLFDIKGTKLSDLVKGGQVTVLDVSCYTIVPGAEGIRALVIGLVAQKLFIERMIARKKEEYEEVHKYDYFSKQEENVKKERPLVWLIVDEAHEFLPNKGKTAATNALVTILREGRQPGISLILASQQPGKIHTDVMTQSDVVIAHRITAKVDIDALGMLMQSYMREGLDKQLNYLPRVSGAGIVFDDVNERLYPMRVRPRFTWHGGGAPTALHEVKKEFEL